MYEPITTGALTLSGPITGMLVGLPLALIEMRFLLEFTFHNISRTSRCSRPSATSLVPRYAAPGG